MAKYKLPLNKESLCRLGHEDPISIKAEPLMDFSKIKQPTVFVIKQDDSRLSLLYVEEGKCLIKLVNPAPILEDFFLKKVVKVDCDKYLDILFEDTADSLLFQIIEQLRASQVRSCFPVVLILLSYLEMFPIQTNGIDDCIVVNSKCINCGCNSEQSGGIFCSSTCFDTFTDDTHIFKEILEFRRKSNSREGIGVDDLISIGHHVVRHVSKLDSKLKSVKSLITPDLHKNIKMILDYRSIKQLALNGTIRTPRNKFISAEDSDRQASKIFDESKGSLVFIDKEEEFLEFIRVALEKYTEARFVYHIFNLEHYMGQVLRSQESDKLKVS